MFFAQPTTQTICSPHRPARRCSATAPFASTSAPTRYLPSYVNSDHQKTTWLEVGEGKTRLEICSLSPARRQELRMARGAREAPPPQPQNEEMGEAAGPNSIRIREEMDGIAERKMILEARMQHVAIGVAQSAGVARHMEDRHQVLPAWTPRHLAVGGLSSYPIKDNEHHTVSDCDYAAIFDGHYGTGAAELAASRLHHYLDDALPAAILGDESAMSGALKGAFLSMDTEILNGFRENPHQHKSGTTALVSLRVGRDLYTANAGDCRAVLCRGGSAVPLTEDHKPGLASERARLQERGAQVEFQRGWRVLMGERDGLPARGVSVSRGLGDLHFKEPVRYLESEPDVHHTLLTPEDTFLIMGSDGLWGSVSNQMAVDVVSQVLKAAKKGAEPQQLAAEAAKKLMYRALDRGSMDNVTAMVMLLQWEQ